MTSFIGNNPEQIPLNGTLGNMAFQSKERVNITGGTLANVTITNPTVPALNNTVIANGTLSDTVEAVGTSNYNIASQYDIGTAPNQIPLNQYLGTMAFQDASAITTPFIVGGNTPSASLTLQSTSAAGTSDSIIFKVGNNGATTAMTINTSGNVGIGTASPASKFVVSNAGAAGIELDPSTSSLLFYNRSGAAWTTSLLRANDFVWQYAGGTEGMRLSSGGSLGVGTNNPSAKFVVSNSGAAGIELSPSDAGGPVLTFYNRSGAAWVAANYHASEHIWRITNATERMRLDPNGNLGIGTASPTQRLTVNGAVGYNAPVTTTSATYTVGTTDNWVIANVAGTCTLTLPTASSFTGRIITVKNVQAQTVVSASSNVVPIGSTTAGTAILAATAGKFAKLVSDGTNWVIMQAN